MTQAWITFWLVMTGAVVIWYSTITIYVAIRGAVDIKGMLGRLRNGNLENGVADAPEGTEKDASGA